MQLNKTNVFERAKQLKVDFIVGTSFTKGLSGLHVTDKGPASLNDALSTAIDKDFDRIYIYAQDSNGLSKINTALNSSQSEYSKIKLNLDNLKNTFGIDILKAVVMSELTLTEGK